MKKIFFLVVSLIAILIGAYLGNVCASLYSEISPNIDKTKKLDIHESVHNRINDPESKIARTAQSWRETNLGENLINAISNDDSTTKPILIYQLLSKASEDELIFLINTIDSFNDISADNKSLLIVMLLSRLTEISPELGINLSIESLNKHELSLEKQIIMYGLFSIWAKSKPALMFDYLLSHEQYKENYLALLFEHWSARDFSEALLALNKLDKNDTKALYGMVDGTYIPIQFSQLLPIILAEKNVDLQSAFFRQWARTDAISVAEWLANNTKVDEAKEQKRAIFSFLVMKNFTYAVDWYFANTKDNFSRPEFSYSNFYEFITPNQYVQVLDWLTMQNSVQFNTAATWMSQVENSVARNAIKFDLNELRRYVVQISDQSRKKELSYMVYAALAKQDMSKAKAFLIETDLINDAEFVSQAKAIDHRISTPCIGYC